MMHAHNDVQNLPPISDLTTSFLVLEVPSSPTPDLWTNTMSGQVCYEINFDNCEHYFFGNFRFETERKQDTIICNIILGNSTCYLTGGSLDVKIGWQIDRTKLFLHLTPIWKNLTPKQVKLIWSLTYHSPIQIPFQGLTSQGEHMLPDSDLISAQDLNKIANQTQRDADFKIAVEENILFKKVLGELSEKLITCASRGEFSTTVFSTSDLKKRWFKNAPREYDQNWNVMQRLLKHLEARNFQVKIVRERSTQNLCILDLILTFNTDYLMYSWNLVVSWT